MNYATALEFPTWAVEVQRYSNKVISYTPITFKAFSKTIGPRLLETLKDLSYYYIQCGQGAGAWAMTAAGVTHNPLQAAVRAAHAELTSAEAQATYSRIRHIIHEAAMDAFVVALCGVIAVVTTIETVQAIYRQAVALYRRVQARFNPTPAAAPTVEIAFAATDENVIAAIVAEVQYERYFTAQFDQLDTNIQLIMEEQVNEAIAQVSIDNLKSARAALVLAQESDQLAQEALSYVVDQTVRLIPIQQQPVAEVSAVDALAASLEVPGATGTPKRQRKASTSKTAEAKPKVTTARANANSGK